MKWIGEPPNQCDIDGKPIVDVFYDGATRTGRRVGPWGFMCQDCFERNGVGLGTGRGQKYQLINNEWTKTGG